MRPAVASSRVFLSQTWLGRLGGSAAGLTAPAPQVPYLSSPRSALGAGSPPAFVSAEPRSQHGSEQPPAEITLIVCAAGSAPLFLTW